MTVNYSGTGSSAGRTDFINQAVDFAVSEIPFQAHPDDGSTAEAPTTGYAYMPIVAGGTAFMYNLKIGGKRVTNLRLSGEVITKIFTGVITNWNDPQIVADNPALAMPDKNIVPVIRSDGSGSTAQFTLWMSKQYPDLWNGFCASVQRPVPCGLTSQYPIFGPAKAQNGSLGVAGYVSQDYGEGAITYVEYSYALKSGFPVAKVLNNAGYYVEPKAPAVAVALMQAQINDDPSSPDYLTQILDGVYNNADDRTYPLSSYSYLIVPTQYTKTFGPPTASGSKGATLGAFASYFLCEGQQQAADLGYSPLPMNLVIAGMAQIGRIPDTGGTNVDINSCHNPTFNPGDSPETNQLAITAPHPAACDQQGPTQCTGGTGGAPDPTDNTGGGGVDGDGSGDGAGAGDGSAGAGDGGGGTGDAANNNAAGGGAAPVYDENGALVSGGGSGSGNGGAAAVSSPFSLPDSGWGVPQLLMFAAAVFLVASIVVPPLVSRRIKSPGRDSAG
jgi:phosphate transport system substrate-binding protein